MGCHVGSSSLKLAEVVVEGLDIGEDTHRVWFTPHDHHVLYLDQTVTARLHPVAMDTNNTS